MRPRPATVNRRWFMCRVVNRRDIIIRIIPTIMAGETAMNTVAMTTEIVTTTIAVNGRLTS